MPNAAHIAQPGTYQVEIRNPHWERMPEKNGDNNRMQLVLPGYAKDDLEEGKEVAINGYLLFLSTIYASGRNAGKAMWEVAAQNCIDLGMSAPFSPEKITELEGAQAQFVVQEEEYEGKKRLKVQFINGPNRREQLSTDDAAAIWSALTSNGETSTAPATKDDDIPF